MSQIETTTSPRRAMNVRVQNELYAALAAVAEAEGNSVGSVARRALALGVVQLSDAQIRPANTVRFEAR